MTDQSIRILSSALKMSSEANAGIRPSRRVSAGVVAEIVNRSLALTASLPFSLREHAALRDVSDFISLSQRGHSQRRYSLNTDLLPICHPLSTRPHALTAAALRESRARWVSDDPFIKSDEARALVASLHSAPVGSLEHEYYMARVLSAPQGTVPLRALIAALGGNSSAARSARAKLQRRDRKGRFAWMGGGMSVNVRMPDGSIRRLTGRLVAQGGADKSGDTDTFDFETPDGKIYRVKASSGESNKAYIESPDAPNGISPVEADIVTGDPVADLDSLETVEAPAGFYKVEDYSGPGEAMYTDEAFNVVKYDKDDVDAPDPTFKDIDFEKPVYAVTPWDDDTKEPYAFQSWDEVQDFIRSAEITRDEKEGRTPPVLARLKDDQLDKVIEDIQEGEDAESAAKRLFGDLFGEGGGGEGPSAPAASDEFPDAPEGAYLFDTSKKYVPEGRDPETQESKDYTDDPTEIANRDYTNDDLIQALKTAVMPKEDGSGAPEYGQLEFESGMEDVPAEALYEAINARKLDAKDILGRIYSGEDVKAPSDEEEAEEEAPEAPEAVAKLPAALPTLLEGLSDEEKAQFDETGDYKPFLPKNDDLFPPEGTSYHEMWPDPFENTTENSDLDPLNLANEISTDDLKDALRESLEPGNDGMGSVLKTDEDGEEVKTSVPAEALRDALQLQGEDTNDFIKSVYDEGTIEEPSDSEATDIIEEIGAPEVDETPAEEPVAEAPSPVKKAIDTEIDTDQEPKPTKWPKNIDRVSWSKGGDWYWSGKGQGWRLTDQGLIKRNLDYEGFDGAASKKEATDETRQKRLDSLNKRILAEKGQTTKASQKRLADLEAEKALLIEMAARKGQTLDPTLPEPEEVEQPKAEIPTTPEAPEAPEAEAPEKTPEAEAPEEPEAPSVEPEDVTEEPTPEAPEPTPAPKKPRAKSETGKYYSVTPEGEIDKKMQYTDEYIEHIFSTPASDLTLNELSDLENISSQVPASVRPFVAGALTAAKAELDKRNNGSSKEPFDSKFTGEQFVAKGKRKKKATTPTEPTAPAAPQETEAPEAEAPSAEAPEAEAPAAEEIDDGTIAIPDTPHKAIVKVKELMPGDITVKDHFVIEDVFTDEESLNAAGKATYGMKVRGHYPGHESQATKIWDSEAEIEVYRNVEAPEAGDKPALSKPKTSKYSKKNGGKGLYKDETTGEWLPASKADREEYEADLAKYEADLAEAMGSWTPPEGLDEYETAENAMSVDPVNPILITTLTGPELKPGDVTFKNETGDFVEYFVVESVETSEDGKTAIVTGFYPGHVSQTKTWNATTPITIMRGISADQLPQSGDKPALERPKKGDPDIKAKYDEFNAAKKASGELWTPPEFSYDKEIVEEPKRPKAASKTPPFIGPKLKELLDQANGDADVLAQLLQNEEVVYFDFETDGNMPFKSQQPIQIAAYKYKDGKIVDEYVTYINPGTNLGSFYTDKDPSEILKDSDGNPISDEFLATQISREDAVKELVEFLGPDAIVVAHNAPFDVEVLNRQLSEFGIDYEVNNIIDTLALSRQVYDADGYTLEQVASRLGLADAETDWHDARADAAVLEGILFNLLSEMKFSGQGSGYLDYDNAFVLAGEDYKRYLAENKEYKKKLADYEIAKTVSEIMGGDTTPVTVEELVDSVNTLDKIDPDTVGPNDVTPASKIADPLDNSVLSVDGKPISNAWVDDNDNTTDLGPVPVEEWQPGDFFEAKYGGWYEVESIEPDPNNNAKVLITAKFLKNGSKKVLNWVKFNSYKIRRDNSKISGEEPQLTETQPEIPSVPADAEAPKDNFDWNGMEVFKGADGVYYAKNIKESTISNLKAGNIEPPALPFFAPRGGGNNINTGEGYYWDTNGVRHWGKYGAAGALIRRKTADGGYEYFLAKRASHLSTGGGKWAFPGGAHKDLADSQNPTTTVNKEFKEEVGQDLSSLTPVASHDNWLAPDWKYHTNIYDVAPGQMDDLSPKDGENSKVGWFTTEQIKQMAADGELHEDFANVAEDLFDLTGAATPTPEADKPEEVAPEIESLSLPVDMSTWVKTAGPAGSNEGGFYTDPKTGDQYYVKVPKSEAHARNEVLASALYEEAGVKVGRIYLGKDANGKTVLISPIVDGSSPDFNSKKSDPDVRSSAQEGFAVDAWLNNYDAVGLVYDNMITVGNDVYRIDPGGALLFRAQGADKKNQLTPEVTQIDTLRDPSVNKTMADIFGDMTDEQIAESVQKIADITPEKINAYVDAAFSDISPEDAEFLKERLIARRQDLMDRFGVTEKTEDVAPEAVSEETTALDNFDADDEVSQEVTTITPAPGQVSDAVAEAIDSAVSGDVADIEESLSESDDPEAKNLASEIKKAKALADSPEPETLTNEEQASEDLETSKIDDEIDGIDPSVSSEQIDYTIHEHPDLIINQIEATYGPDSNNGDATWTVWSAEANGVKYDAVIVKNKDNTFSAIYRMTNPDGSVVDVDRYGTYHSFPALKNRLNSSVLPTLMGNLATTGGNPKKMAAVYAKLAKNTYWHKTGKSKINLRKVKMTHPTPDGLSEVKVGDRVWDSKTGKFGTVKIVFETYGSYGYTDYVQIKFDDGKKTNAPTTLRIWKAGEDNKLITEPGNIPEFFPNPNPNQAKGASSAPNASTGKKPTPSAPTTLKPPPETIQIPQPEPEPESEVEEVSPAEQSSVVSMPFSELVTNGLVSKIDTDEFLQNFGTNSLQEFLDALKTVGYADAKGDVYFPGTIVTGYVNGKDPRTGVVTGVVPTTGKINVAWLNGPDAGSSTDNLTIYDMNFVSMGRYMSSETAKNTFNIDIDPSFEKQIKDIISGTVDAETLTPPSPSDFLKIPEGIDVSDYPALLSSGLMYHKKSDEMYAEFGAENYNEFKEAIQGQKVKTSDDKNLVPGNVVEGTDSSVGIVTSIDPSSSTINVSWIYGDKAGTSESGIDSKSTTSKEQYVPSTVAKSLFDVEVDTSLQNSAKKFVAEKKAKMSEAQKKAAEEKKAADAAKKAAEAAKKAIEAAKIAANADLVAGSGVDPVVVDGPADWTTSIENTPSLSSTLEKISKNGKSGNNGATVLIDADQIEDTRVRFTKIKNLTGEVRTRLRFKLTEWAGSSLVSDLMSGQIPEGVKVVDVTDAISLRKFKKSSSATALRTEDGVWSNDHYSSSPMYVDAMKNGQTFRLEISDNDGNIIGYADLHRGNKTSEPTPTDVGYSKMTNGSHQNKVDLYLADDATPEDVELALSRLGIAARPATDADVQAVIENKIMSLFGGYQKPEQNLSGNGRQTVLQEIYNNWGFTAADIKPTIIDEARGTIAYQLPREVAEKIAAQTTIKSLHHQWHSSFKSADEVFNLVMGGNFNSAMLPTAVRMDEGINTGGMSSTDDQHTWGADYMFFSGSTYTAENSTGSGSGFVFDIVDIIQNMDWFTTEGDDFGKRKTSTSPVESLSSYFSQFMAKDAIPLTMVKKVKIPNSVKSDLKKMLQNLGITEWNGIPVDKLFGLTSY